MSYRQPLLQASHKFPIATASDDAVNNGNKKQLVTNSFTNWRRYFSRKKDSNTYIKLDDDTKRSDKDEAVDVLRLFQFADRLDFVLMLLALCLMLFHTVCILASLVLFGRVTGLFAIQSFGDNCYDQRQNSIIAIKNNNTYPEGIELNIFNNVSSHEMHHNSDAVLLSTLATSMSSFRKKVMDIVYWLFIIGAVEFLLGSIENFLWTISTKRQICRMSVSIFRSLVQRVSRMYCHLSKEIILKV
ncbi:unnamed protein product [Rotaria sp. Silwood1]|nr:unnamed protein product [Rotaria sp. Silwood1]